MTNNSVRKGLLNGLVKAKRVERSLESKLKNALTDNHSAEKKSEKEYVHPWSKQDLGNPSVVDEIEKSHCCGCASCANICPVNAITMSQDDEGFFYPRVNRDVCIECGKCVSHCPSYCEQPSNDDVEICYATIANNDEMREKSSSGGLFSQIAYEILSKGGVVFGAAYDGVDTVCHKAVTDIADLDELRRSKYVQSYTGETYSEVKELLNDGRDVLYSGCPCQIAGLYAFLGKDYDNLLTVDLICHGSPSPGLFKRYIDEDYEPESVSEINFRDKSAFGWSTHMNAYMKDGKVKRELCTRDPYCLMFLKCLAMRPFCSICKFTRMPRVADLSIGDWWGIEKYDSTLNDRKGTSLLIVNNKKGEAMLESIRENMSRCEELSLNQARPRNYTIDKPFAANPARERFFALLKNQPFDKAVRYALNWHYDIGIYGLWYGENYGSMLTYYGLRQIIESMGLSCVMIENPYIKERGYTLEPHRFAYRQNYCITRRRPIDKMGELNSICDSFLLGSDQLWNPGLSRPYRFTYFLDFVNPNNKRIAYGTSFGKDTHNIDSAYMLRSAYELAKFDAISVRDSFSQNLLGEKYGVPEAQKVLDPAILCEPACYEQLASEAKPIRLTDGSVFDTGSEDYIFTYILDPNDKTLESLREIAKTLDKKILYALDYAPKAREGRLKLLDGSQDFGIHLMDVPSCEQWLRAISDSSCVLTDSFHGTIFAHVFKRNFVSVCNRKRGPKRFTDLLSILGLESRLVDEYIGNEAEISSLLNSEVDFDSSYELLAIEQNASMSWLRNALLMPKKIATDRAYPLDEEMWPQA